eukprot:IDg6844t1
MDHRPTVYNTTAAERRIPPYGVMQATAERQDSTNLLQAWDPLQKAILGKY